MSRIVAAITLFSIFVTSHVTAVPAELNGIRLSASYLILKLATAGDESAPTKPLPPSFSCDVHVRLENISGQTITVVTRPRNFSEKNADHIIIYRFTIRTFDGRPFRPSLYSLAPITLAPGEIAELPSTYTVGPNEEDLIPTKVIYHVTDEFGAMLKVWSGQLEAVPTNEMSDDTN